MLFNNNLFIFITLAFMSGIWAGAAAQLPLNFLYALAVLAAMLVIAAAVYKTAAGLKMTAALFFVIGMLAWGHFSFLPENDISRFAEQSVVLEGTVGEIPQTKKLGADTVRTRYIIDVSHIVNAPGNNSQPVLVSGRLRLNAYFKKEFGEFAEPENNAKIKYGDKVRIVGEIIKIQGYNNPSSIDIATDLKRQGIRAAMNVKSENIEALKEGATKNSWRQKLADWKESVLNTMQETLSLNNKGILSALIFGIRQDIAPDILKNFAAAGIIHILSISGTHIVIVAGFLNWLGNLLKIPTTFTAFFAAAGILAYAFISDLSPPVIRASVMGIISIIAVVLNREKDASNSLALSALAMLAVSPALIFNISFQLSFSATAGLIFLYPPIKNHLSFLPKWLNEPVSITIAAQLASLPFIVWYFNSVSLIAVISNLIILPVLELALILGLAGAAIHAFWQKAASLVFIAAGFQIEKSVQLAAFLAAIPGAVLYVPTFGALGGIIYYAGLLCWCNRKSARVLNLAVFLKNFLAKKRSKAAAGILGLILLAYIYYPKPLAVHFIDVGQGDSALIITPGGEAVLVDTGGVLQADISGFDVGERIIAPYLKHYGIRTVEYLVLTHGHQDHAGGAAGVAENLKVNNIILAKENHSIAVENLLSKAVKAVVIPAYAGQFFNIDGVSFFVEHAGEAPSYKSSTSNEISSVVRVSYGRHSFLFTGDLEAGGEAELLEKGSLLPTTVLKVGHHGSKSSTTQKFLDVLSPEYAVISAGYNNRFGHPHQDVLTRLAVKGVKVYRTDLDGAIVFYSDGETLEVNCYRKKNKE